MNLTVITRLAALFAGLAVVGALLATFVPAEYRDGPCGTWADPEWTQPEADELVESVAVFNPARAASAADRIENCDDALDNRRALTIGLMVTAILIPVVGLIVTSPKRQRPE